MERIKYNQETFIETANEVHGNFYDYSLVVFEKMKVKVEIICPVHGVFWQEPSKHLSGCRCKQCFIDSLTKTTEQFIQDAKAVHEDRFDYSKTEYKGAHNPVIIMCKDHGEFSQIPYDHLKSKDGCPDCRLKTSRKTTEQFITEARVIHGDKYDYSKTKYIDSQTKMIIICPIHGEFLQTPERHLGNGIGCEKCSYDLRRNTTEEFIEAARKIHGDKYDYSKVNYVTCMTPVIIICPKHGEFLQTPNVHVYGQCGCPHCVSTNFKSQNDWLTYLNIPEKYWQSKIYISDRLFKPDAYVPETNTVYEFWGDYWHGNLNRYNPNDINANTKLTYDELNRLTEEKKQLILEAGYSLIEIWEEDWIKLKEELKIT